MMFYLECYMRVEKSLKNIMILLYDTVLNRIGGIICDT